jgi:flagellar basal body-associated protein FliL
VLVPSGEAGFVYVTAGVSIDYTDARAATEINNHLPLYRDIIFEAMGQALASEKIDKITEVDLLAKIKEALNRSLPGRYVEQVQFKAFSTG